MNTPAPKTLYRLQSISFLDDRNYLVKLARGNDGIEVACEIKTVDVQGLEAFDLVEFKSDAFNDLCTHGDVYAKPLGKAILAFHECRSAA